MLVQTILIYCGTSLVFGQPKTNDVDANYFIGAFNNAEFAAAFGFCNPSTVIGGIGNIATCIDDEVVRYESYSNSFCFGDPRDVPIYYTSPIVANSSSEEYLYAIIEADFNDNFAYIFSDKTIDDVTIEMTQTGTGSLYDFKCDGTDEYAAVSLQLAPCDDGVRFYTYYAALDSCAQNCGNDETNLVLEPEDYTSLRVYCDAQTAELQYFENPGTCDSNCSDANFYQVRNLTRTCGYFLTSGCCDIYGFMDYCSLYPNVTAAPDPPSPTKLPTLPATTVAPTPQNNYFIGQFDAINVDAGVPMALDACNPLGVNPNSSHGLSQMATCIDEDTATYTIYSDEDCTTAMNGYPVTVVKGTSGEGEFMDFNCDEDGMNATASAVFSLGPGCESASNKVSFEVALSACTSLFKNSIATFDFYCDSEALLLQIYAFGCSDETFQFANETITRSCDLYGTIAGFDVYARITDCSEASFEPTAAMTTGPSLDPVIGDGASTMSSSIEIIVAAFVTIIAAQVI